MNTVYRASFSVRATECDFRSRMRPDALFVQMQEAAEKNSCEFHNGLQDLATRGLFFALVRTHVVISRQPAFDETVLEETWPGNSNRFFLPRYHRFTSEDGAVLATAASLWVVLGRKTRSIISPQKAGVYFADTSDIMASAALPLRPPVWHGKTADGMPYLPAYSDIDLNGHVNNTRYITWLCDALGPDAFSSAHIEEMTISYEKEVKPGSQVMRSLSRDGASFFFLVSSPSGERHFTAGGTLKPDA